MPPVLKQGHVNACAANAVANALNYEFRRGPHTLSRMFMYYVARHHILGMADLAPDAGCSLRDVCRAVMMFGACDEGMWPYARKLIGRRPPPRVYKAARALPQVRYEMMAQKLPHLVDCLVRGHPIVMGMSVFTNIRGARHTGVISMPGPGDVHLGGHAVVLCGYDMRTRFFRIQNCWGTAWGDEGYMHMPFEYVLDPELCWDIWVFRV